MAQRGLVVAGVFAVGAGLVGLAAAGTAELEQVWVQNFPETQQVRGSVTVTEPVPHAVFLRREGLIVPQARRTESNDLVFAGVVESAGFTGAVLSLQGEVQDSFFSAGDVGVLLIPDEAPILDALRRHGRIDLALEAVAAAAPSAGARFSSAPTAAGVAFPRYRAFLYNTTNRSAEVNLYVYLTH